jgi:hypothetical protein
VLPWALLFFLSRLLLVAPGERTGSPDYATRRERPFPASVFFFADTRIEVNTGARSSV